MLTSKNVTPGLLQCESEGETLKLLSKLSVSLVLGTFSVFWHFISILKVFKKFILQKNVSTLSQYLDKISMFL